jgi:hypothetical protein
MDEQKLMLVKLSVKDAEISFQAAEIRRLRAQLQTEREIHERRLQAVAEELNEYETSGGLIFGEA